jgi:GT2 family glycosyltransferase
MAPPAMAVVLPVFNGHRFLNRAICSVLEQRLSDFELLIGDDASTDACLEVIRRFKDKRIRCFERPSNLGLFPNLNQLLAAVRAPLVRFLCQDDCLMPDCLECEVRFFARHPEVGMSFCKATIVDENDQMVSQWALGDIPEKLSSLLSTQFLYFYGCIPGNLSTVSARRSCFQEAGGFDESFRVAGDYEMWTRLCRRGAMGVIHQRLIRMRSHGAQLSRARESEVRRIREVRRIQSALAPRLPRSVRRAAALHHFLRLNVLDAQHFLRCLSRLQFGDSVRVAHAMGLRDLLAGILCWLLTGRNRWYRPVPRFVYDQDAGGGGASDEGAETGMQTALGIAVIQEPPGAISRAGLL